MLKYRYDPSKTKCSVSNNLIPSFLGCNACVFQRGRENVPARLGAVTVKCMMFDSGLNIFEGIVAVFFR